MSYPGLDANPTSSVIFPYQTGFFISPYLAAFNGNIGTTSTTVIVPIKIENAISIDAVRILAGSSAYTNWKFGLYNIDESSSPAALGTAIVESTSLTGTNSTSTTHTFTSTPVSRGSYWLALSPQFGSGEVAVITSIAVSATQNPNNTALSNQTGAYTGFINTSGSSPEIGVTTGATIAASDAFTGAVTAAPIATLRVA